MELSNADDIQVFGKKLFIDERERWNNFEETAQAICQRIHTTFQNEQGDSDFALVRIFRSCTHEELPPEAGRSKPSERWLALMGTHGDESAWCNRLQSEGHRILPAGAFETPMLKAAFEQINLNVNAYVRGERLQATFLNEEEQLARYFHVPRAAGSPYVVDQETFVQRYGIQSVVGFGATFLSGAFFMCLGFSKITLTDPMAHNFVKLSPYISTLLASQDGSGALWK